MTITRVSRRRRPIRLGSMALLKWSFVSLSIFAFALAFVVVFSGMLSAR